MSLFQTAPNLHPADHDARFCNTHLGQAHIAGTGPSGKTCRECVFYGQGLKGWPDYYTSGANRNGLKQTTCKHPIPGKSSRKFPHYAQACVLFEQNATPPATALAVAEQA